ncbi:hypothetical protein SMICM17S_06465 [Streptomyces microflavus]
MLVLTMPGHMALTPIDFSASSARRHSLSISTAAFDVLYAGSAREG